MRCFAEGALVAALLAACNSGDPEGRPDAGGSPGDGAVREASFDARAQDGSRARFIETIRGRFVDAEGRPVAEGLLVTACGPRECSPGRTDVKGDYAIPVGFALVPADYSVLAHGRPERAGYYFALPAAAKGPEVDLGTRPLLDLPDVGTPLIVDRGGASAQSVTSSGVTLAIPDQTYVRLDVESNLLGESGREFRVARVPDALLASFAPEQRALAALYLMEPFECRFERAGTGEAIGVGLSFPNERGLPPGASLDVLALGTYLHPEWVTPGALEPVAAATVSADGSRVELDPEHGIPYLTAIGLRERSP